MRNKETDEEYVARVVTENKEYYKTPDALVDQMSQLITGLKHKECRLSEEQKWRMLSAVSEAWHVMLFEFKEDYSSRLVNTILSFLKKNPGPAI